MGIKSKLVLWKKWIGQDIFFIKQIIQTSVNNKRIFLFDTADHDNYGDHAIAIAERQFVQKMLPEYSIIEIPGGNILRHTKVYKMFSKKQDIITIAGGGFLGSLWPYEEHIVQTVLKLYPYNKVVIFPQTFFVEEDENEFKKKNKEYFTHKNILICLRDEESCNRIKKIESKLEDNIFYMPDMACGMMYDTSNISIANEVAICFRKDKESVLGVDEKRILEEFVKSKGLKITEISTINDEAIQPKERYEKVYAKLKDFAQKRLVITDRLHAMIFSALVGTPCIAMDNKSGKVRGVYKWIADQGYIYYAQNIEEAIKYLNKIDLSKRGIYDASFVSAYWERLAKWIRTGE